MTYDPNNIEKDAARYRRLRVLGAPVYGSEALKNSTVQRFDALDFMIDADIHRNPSRGEVNPAPAAINRGIETHGKA